MVVAGCVGHREVWPFEDSRQYFVDMAVRFGTAVRIRWERRDGIWLDCALRHSDLVDPAVSRDGSRTRRT